LLRIVQKKAVDTAVPLKHIELQNQIGNVLDQQGRAMQMRRITSEMRPVD
jgi:hypothetical protein